MKNTLIIRREFISQDVIDILKSSNSFAIFEVIDNGHSYIINFNPNKDFLEKEREKYYNIINKQDLNVSGLDVVVEGLLFSSIAALYSKVFSALMQGCIEKFILNNKDKVSSEDVKRLIGKLS